MAIIEHQINNIKSGIIEMMALARKQVARSQEALFNFDKEITEEIIANEKKLNALDLKIDKDCEQTLALYNPVADDLRLIISVLSINTFLERIGDNAESIAKFINDFDKPFDTSIYNKLRLMEMYEHVLFMFDIVTESFENEDTSRAIKVFKIDKSIDEINESATKTMAEIIKSDLDNTEAYLRLISVVRKLERLGDLLKNIAEETIFYVDAKVLKHKTKKKKKLMDEEDDL
jgi:phosphate transport system protein